MHSRRTIAVVLLAHGCLAPPKLDVPAADETSTGIVLDTGDEDPFVPESSSDAGDTGTTGAIDPSDTGAIETSTTSADTGSGETTGDTGGGAAGFPPDEPFGDDVRELDLVGTWTVPWDPTGVADVSIAIASDGAFVWRETEADCTLAGSASGHLWVESTQLVMHVDAWDKREPWDVSVTLGQALAVPFRMRLGYAPMGGFLGISARKQLTHVMQWHGVGYSREGAGMGPSGAWVAEAELWAVPDGEAAAELFVRDRFSAGLISSGAAMIDHAWTWWWPQQGAEQDDAKSDAWTDDTPGNVAGAATIAGDPFAYDATYLMAFASDRSFKLGVVSDCP